jgi:hypothetical protein
MAPNGRPKQFRPFRTCPPLPQSGPNDLRTRGGGPLQGGHTHGSRLGSKGTEVPLLLSLLPWMPA